MNAPASAGRRIHAEELIYQGQLHDDTGLQLVGYPLEKHLLTFGSPGTGKSTSLLVPNLYLLRRSIVVIDPKGQLAAITARHRRKLGKVIVLNPFNILVDDLPWLKSDGWNPLLQLDRASSDFSADARTISEAIVDRSGGGRNEFFDSSTENLWTVFCMWERMTKGRAASLRNVREAFTRPDFEATLEVMTKSDNYAIRVNASFLHKRLTDKNSQSTALQDVIATIMKNTAFLEDELLHADMMKGGAIDFRQMQEEITTVYVILPVNRLLKQAKWLRIFVNVALSEFFKGATPEPVLPPVLMMLDEFGNLGRLPEIVNALNISRDFRVQMWMCLQNLHQLQKRNYPDDWTSFFSGAGAISFFGAHDPETSKILSDLCGKREVDMTSHSLNGLKKMQFGHSTSTQVFPLLQSEDARRLGAGRTVNFIDPVPMPTLLETPGYWNIVAPGILDDNPYRKGG